MLLDGYYRYSNPTDSNGDGGTSDDPTTNRCCSDEQRETRPLCDDCQNYSKCDVCHKDVCILCVKESSQFQCCGLKLCGAGCRNDHHNRIGSTSSICPKLRPDQPMPAGLDVSAMFEVEESMGNESFMNCEERHSVTQLSCGPNHVGCNFYPGHCRACEELFRDSTEWDKQQRDVALLLSVMDKLESASMRALLREIMGDPQNVKRKQIMEERIVDLERSLKKARRSPDHEVQAYGARKKWIAP